MATRLLVSDLLTRLGATRRERLGVPIEVSLTQASIAGEAMLDVQLAGIGDGILVRGTASVTVRYACNRCLTEWDENLEVGIDQVYRVEPEDIDTEMVVDATGWIDVGATVHDEIILALQPVPLCAPDCRGLCPECGTDLNTEPCAGHGDASSSPFAALEHLFDS